jgi:AcrR family transcriptional regulator
VQKKATRKPRLGRPPDTDSADTRRRILDVARATFATRGYESTTNRTLAAEAGLTAGAIYHHFGSKAELYVAVQEDAIGRVTERFLVAVAEPKTFLGKFEALLDEAHEMNVQDPTLARFLGAFRVDVQRDPELAQAMQDTQRGTRHFSELIVDVGVSTGEIAPEDRPMAVALVRVFLVGLTDAVSSDRVQHRNAVNGMKKLIEGRLLHPVAPSRKPKRA